MALYTLARYCFVEYSIHEDGIFFYEAAGIFARRRLWSGDLNSVARHHFSITVWVENHIST